MTSAFSVVNPVVRSRAAATAVHTAENLRIVNPLFGSDWDEAISRHPSATIFHTSRWARVLQETYGYRPFYLLSDGISPAALCLFEVNSWLTGRRGVSLPFTDECPALESSGYMSEALFDRALFLGKERRWKHLELRGTHSAKPLATPSISFYTHSLDLRQGPDVLFANFAPAIRRGIRKAQESKLQVSHETSRDSLLQYYELHCLTRRKHGLPPQPLRFFENIHRHILQPGFGFITLVKLGTCAIAGAVYFLFNNCALYKFSASDPNHESRRPNNLVMWEAIRHIAGVGAEYLAFGRTSLHNDGLRRYKLNWGASESTSSYFKWNFRSKKYVQEMDRSVGIQTALFRRCPRRLARIAGTLLYPHIA